jgi:hypothetical protein
MAGRILRRRALARGLALVCGVLSWQFAGARQVGAQPMGPDADDPLPDPPVPGLPPLRPDIGDDMTDPSDPVVEAPDEDVPPTAPAPTYAGVPPIKLTIPALGVEAVVEPVGQEPDGAMATPTDPDDVAWYAGSPGMGVAGNVVLAAHVNWDLRLRPFGLLHKLEPGDAVQVIDADGRGFEYVVVSSHWVRAEGAPVEEIFAPSSEPILTMITCGGEFVASRREYLDRLIVKAKGA